MMWLDENGNLFYLEQPQEYYTDDHMQEQPQEYYTDDHMQEQPLEYYTKDHLQEYFNNDQSNEESFQTSKVVSLLSGTEDLNSQQDVLLPSKSTIFVTPAPVEPTAEGLVLANDDGMLHKMIENDNIDDVVNEPEAEFNDDTDVVATDTDLDGLFDYIWRKQDETNLVLPMSEDLSPSLYVIDQHDENNTENIDNEQNNNEENLGVAEQKNP